MTIRKFLFMSSSGFAEEQAATDELSLGKITLAGVSGVAIDAGGAAITNIESTPSGPSNATSKSYVDAIATGLRDYKESVRAMTTGNVTLSGGAPNSTDAILLSVNDRVLVANQTNATENGVYVVQTLGTGSNGTWVRSTDADANSEVTSGMHVYVEEGATYSGTGWVLSTANPITLGSTNLTFAQFSSVQAITAGAGLIRTGNSIDVELASIPGLEFDVGGASGKLQFKPDTARGLAKDGSGAYVNLATNPGLQFSSGALDAKLNANGGLTKDASGLAILPDPTANNISLSSTGAAVTKAPVTSDRHTASEAIALGKVVYISGSNTVGVAQSTSDARANAVVGVAAETISSTATGSIVKRGRVNGVLAGATPGTNYHLGSNGDLVLIGSVGLGQRNIRVGIALNTTDLEVHIIDYGKKAL